MDPRIAPLANLGVGLGALLAALTVSWMPHVKDWLQILSLVIGCAVGIVTLRNALKKKNERHRGKRHERDRD